MVLHDVSLAIPAGEITTLLGPNGAGKSTLVLAVGGVLRTTSGRVLLGEQDLTHRRPEQVRGAGVAIVPEGRRLLPGLTVEDNLRVATYSLDRAAAKAGVDQALELFPELERRWKSGVPAAVRWRAADGRAGPGARLAPEGDPRRRAVARSRPGCRETPRAVLEAVAASGVGVLLIEQFAHVALGLAQERPTSSRAGASVTTAPHRLLKEDPELLRSAYLCARWPARAAAARGRVSRRRSAPLRNEHRATRDLTLTQLRGSSRGEAPVRGDLDREEQRLVALRRAPGRRRRTWT